MELKEVTIKLSEENLLKLENSAKAAGKEPQQLAAEIVSQSLTSDQPKPVKPAFPAVALMRETAVMPEQRNLLTNGQLYAATVLGNNPIAPITPEILRRRQEIEARMRELSILIDTASEDKKEDYALQYAMLAAELEATI